MKKLFLASVCLFLLSGCTTLCETESPVIKKKFASEVQLRLENFRLVTSQAPKHNIGWSVGSGYNLMSNSFSLGGGPYIGATYQQLPDAAFAADVKDIFESAGANIRTKTPALIVEGRIGEGHYMWDSGAMWYRDAPIFLFTICTLGSIVSHERENDVKMIVYHQNGRKLKEYSCTSSYYVSGLGFPLALLANDKMYSSYGDRMATEIALISCLNSFILDYNRGLFR